MVLEQPLAFLSLKPISKAFILAELLDILTTTLGLTILPQIQEANPLPLLMGGWAPVVLLKVAAVILVVYVLERVQSWPAFVRIIPVAAFLPVLWNIICILAEFTLRG